MGGFFKKQAKKEKPIPLFETINGENYEEYLPNNFQEVIDACYWKNGEEFNFLKESVILDLCDLYDQITFDHKLVLKIFSAIETI